MTTPGRERCITCSDDAVTAEVVAVHGAEAIVTIASKHESVAIDLVPDTVPGDVLLCHAGIALERLERTRPDDHLARSRNVSGCRG